ncbi:hypothetical protein Mrose_03542 [Calidithermus roseus]|uniref:Uncharacterized protein n=2 Tax=Calidithermus roseus TaxID=1644118 RepID=A0A399EHI8_9DEIN|nr:hypothetical protein Mrose_03542 [Calidithermus roseus]
MSPYVVALSAWPHERWGVMHDPSGREPIPREAAVLLRRAGLLEGLSQGIYPATALLLDGEGRLWQGSFARVMEAVETQPQIEDFRNYLRHGALLPPDFSFFSGKAPDPSEEDEDDEEQPGIQFDIEDASELDLPPIPPQGVRERALLRQALRKLEEHPGPS